MSELAETAKEQAKNMLLEGETNLEAIQEATSLSPAVVRGIKGSLVRSGQLPSKAKRSKPEASEVEDPDSVLTERDTVKDVLLTAGCPKKKLESILTLTDSNGYDVEGFYRAMSDTNLSRALKNTALKLYSTAINEDIPDHILDELKTSQYSSRDRDGRERRLTLSEWKKENEISELSDQVKELKNLIQGGGGGMGGFTTRAHPGQRYREMRTPIDRNGVPCDPQKAHSVRYERIPIGEGGDGQVSQLRREIQDLKDKMYSDQIAGLANQIEDLKERGSSDVGAIVSGVKDVLTTWSSSEGGPLVKAASPLADAFGRRVLENYEGINSMTPEMRNPEEGTPETLLGRLRGEGLVSNLRRRKGGGRPA